MHREFALHPVELECPRLEPLIARIVHTYLALHHLKVRGKQRDAGQARGKTASEVPLVHFFQGDRYAGINKIPRHEEVLQDGVHVGIDQSVLLVVEGFQFQ